MAAKHPSPSTSAARKPGPRRDPGGVVATMERLTGITPCPKDLRNCANKYLRSKLLFPTPRGPKVSNREKLTGEGAQTLLMNALALDEIFRGDTTLVVRVLLNDVKAVELKEHCLKATREIEQRIQIYDHWQQRMPAVESLLCGNFDPEKTRIDEMPHPVDIAPDIHVPAPFALRAVRTLERMEQGRRQQGARASDLVQQADAYLALGDFDAAALRARRATELEPGNVQARFVHVVAALKQRNQALSQMQRHQIEASEFADPLSAHERSARDAADEEASKASSAQVSLDLVVPEALLNWPTGAWGQHEHPEWRHLVVDLMLSQTFRKIRIGGELGESRRAFELNGFAEEWRLKLDTPELPRAAFEQAQEPPPLRQAERDALSLLFAEHARYRLTFFNLRQLDFLARDFRLLHLRWVLGNDGYEQHWQSWIEDMQSSLPAHFEKLILNDETLAPLWFAHCARHGGVAAAQMALSKWRSRYVSKTDQNVTSRTLDLQVLAFHHQFARDDFTGCRQTCDQAEQLIAGGTPGIGSCRHPLESFITVPAGNSLYWQYLRILVVVNIRASNGHLDEDAKALLADAAASQQKFKDNGRCFWLQSEEYEDGGGEDFHTPPYDIDLCETENWHQPVRNRDRPFLDFNVHHPQLSKLIS